MALLGRAVFFATWTVVTIMFPKVIEKEKRGEPHDRLFWISLSIVAGIGSMMVVGSYLFGDVVMQVAFGPAYAETAQYLWVYALLTAFFSCANVFVYYYMSLEKYLPVFISLVAGALQIILVCIFHNTIEQVLYVQSLCMAGLLSIMVLYRIFLVRISSHVRPVSRGKEVVISRSPIFNN